MTLQNDSAAERQLASQERLDAARISAQLPLKGLPSTSGVSGQPVKIGKRSAIVAGKEAEVFTMSLGPETIELLPLKNWAQLDLYKWRARGRLPGTPAGLEVGFDHIKLLGQTVLPQDPEACAKLEDLFSEWLAMERETLELAKRKAQLKAAAPTSTLGAASPEDAVIRYQVELDKEGQVHIRCVRGKEVLATIGLNVPGFHSLVNQGWLRKPQSLKTGALHDWVELDGKLFSFEKGADNSAELARVLNECYLPHATLAKDKEVVVYANAASSTGFDIQFPAKVGGVLENRRRPLGEESLILLQDHEHCGLVRKGLIIKLSRPYFIFKQKTPDGGERSLEQSPDNIVRVPDDSGGEKLIDLSQPVSYLKLSAVELTAVFNHPAINPHTRTAPPEPAPSRAVASLVSPVASPPQAAATHAPPETERKPSAAPSVAAAIAVKPQAAERAPQREAPATSLASASALKGNPDTAAKRDAVLPPPNLWLKPVLQHQPIRFDWFTCLVYARIATWVGNSNQGQLFDSDCWFIQLGESADPAEPDFKCIFDTRNGAFGLLSGGHVIRFEEGAAFLGSAESPLKAPHLRLQAVGMDAAGSPVFIVPDGYRPSFGVPESEVISRLNELKNRGAMLLSIGEVMASRNPLEAVWTVPAQQSEAAEPEAIEHLRSEFAP